MGKIRVLAIGHSFVLSINRTFLRELAKDPGFDVTITSPSYFYGDLRRLHMEPEPNNSPLKVYGIGAYFTNFVHLFSYNLDHLERLFKEEKFDLVYIWEEPYIFSGYQIAKVAKKYGVPFCFRTNQGIVKNYPFPFSYFESYSIRNCIGWVSGGNLSFEAMIKKGFPQTKGKILTLSVDTELYKPISNSEKEVIVRGLGLTPPVVGFLGRFTESKGLDILMQALSLVKERASFSFLAMGSGPYEKKIKQWAKDGGLEDKVRIKLLKHDEVSQVLPAIDLLVAPSQTMRNWKEQFGRMIIEAFASGVPVIASDSGEIPSVVADAGIIVPEKDIEGFAKEILRLLNDQSLKDTLIRKGLERSVKFSTFSVAKNYKDYFNSLIGQSSCR